MLPHIHTKDGHLTTNNRVLILGRHDAQALRVPDQPPPAAALQPQKGLAKRRLELLEATPRLADFGHQGRRGAAGVGVVGAAGRQVLPEQRVVDVAAAVELDGVLQRNLPGDVVGRRGGRVRLERVVEVRHVGLVVLAVVQLHDLLGDAGLQGLGKRRYISR